MKQSHYSRYGGILSLNNHTMPDENTVAEARGIWRQTPGAFPLWSAHIIAILSDEWT